MFSPCSGIIDNTGGKILVQKVAGHSGYRGSFSNGVRSLSLPRWRESFLVSGTAGPPVPPAWPPHSSWQRRKQPSHFKDLFSQRRPTPPSFSLNNALHTVFILGILHGLQGDIHTTSPVLSSAQHGSEPTAGGDRCSGFTPWGHLNSWYRCIKFKPQYWRGGLPIVFALHPGKKCCWGN